MKEEDRNGDPCYVKYKLTAIHNETGDCLLVDAQTDEKKTCPLSEINIDWLVTLWNRYKELSIDQGMWQDHADICTMALDGLPCEAEPKVIYKCSVCGGTDVACDARVNPNTVEILNIFDEPDAACEKCGEVDLDSVEAEATAIPYLKKELFAFIWPFQLMPRNATDEQIVTAYENGPSHSVDDEDDDELHDVRKLTPDELAAEINDNDCAFGQYYVRFIEV